MDNEQTLSPLEIKSHLNELDRRNGELEDNVAATKKDIKQKKIQLLQKFYDQLQSLGVDPNNLDSISAYLKQLEQTDPDSLIVIEMILDLLDPEKEGGMATDEEASVPGPMPGMTDMSGAPSLMSAPPAPGPMPVTPTPETLAPAPEAPTPAQ